MSIPIGVQIFSLTAWLLVVRFLQLAVWPALTPAFGRQAYAVAYPASLLAFLAVSWYCGLIGLPLQLALLPFLALFLTSLRQRRYTWRSLREHAIYDIVFLVGFAFMLELRYLNPVIVHFSEQFMDHGFIASIMRHPVVPPLDPWFAGERLDMYYYGGHWLWASLAILTGSPSTVAFNLVPGTILGCAAVSLYAMGDLLLDWFRWLPAATLLLVNPAFPLCILRGDSISWAFQYSQVVVPYTKNEVPLFTLFIGEVHAHLFGLVTQTLLIFLLAFTLVRWEKLSGRGRWTLIGMIALTLGSMPLINMWNVFLYAPLTLFCGAICWWRGRAADDRTPHAKMFLLLVPVLAITLYLPYYVIMGTGTLRGIGLVETPTDPLRFLLFFGFFIPIFIAYVWRDIRTRPYLLIVPALAALAGYATAALALLPATALLARREHSPAEVLAIGGLLAVTACEIVYLQDVYTDLYYRFNTVFKVYFDAWVLMGTAGGLMAGAWLTRRRIGADIPPASRYAAVAVATALLFAAPWAADADFARDVLHIEYDSGYRTLDGAAYLEGAHPGDAAAIRYLSSLPGEFVIVEAEGGDYSYYSRISSFTGIPTILGQRTHEFHWRGNADGWYYERMDDIRAIHEDPDRTAHLMEKYGATHLYVGELEQETYQVSLPAEGLEVIYDDLGVRIYRRIEG
ncbi:MAG: DUF2298 domain-containing protein [Methanomicrobiaceae archaeon]|nr:DUF2298 domain-containing protein [Methanomicrobiaceae archaeon]